uniref:Putative calcium-binding protein CML29-like n=1 Tax=Trifolium medium TaxID=97028 RepID=A0A392MGJ3_9FABA
MMQQSDKNKDGLLCINEFLEMITKGLETGNLANVPSASAFQALDEDGNGILTGEKLHEVMENLVDDFIL